MRRDIAACGFLHKINLAEAHDDLRADALGVPPSPYLDPLESHT